MRYPPGKKNRIPIFQRKSFFAALIQVFTLQDIKHLILIRVDMQGRAAFADAGVFKYGESLAGILAGNFDIVRTDPT